MAIVSIIDIPWADVVDLGGIAKADIADFMGESIPVTPGGFPGPGVVEILKDTFEGSGAEVAWTKDETDGTIDYDHATTETGWQTQCARFNLTSLNTPSLNISKTFTPTPSFYAHVEFIIRSIDFGGTDPSGYNLVYGENNTGGFGGPAGCFMVQAMWGSGDTGSFDLWVSCYLTGDIQVPCNLTLSLDTLYKLDIKFDNKSGGSFIVKLDGNQVMTTSIPLESLDWNDPQGYTAIDKLLIGIEATQTTITTTTFDADNIRATSDDWA